MVNVGRMENSKWYRIMNLSDNDFLISHGWIRVKDDIWEHINCDFPCHTEIAISVQNYRNKKVKIMKQLILLLFTIVMGFAMLTYFWETKHDQQISSIQDRLEEINEALQNIQNN